MDDIKHDPDPLMTSLRNLANRADAEGDQYCNGVARYAAAEIERLRTENAAMRRQAIQNMINISEQAGIYQQP